MLFYDPEEVRQIPLIELADRLELFVDEHGYTPCLAHWKTEETTQNTCSLNEPDNYFRCPCGNSGWAPDLVVQARKWDIVEATAWLGKEFGLKPRAGPPKTDYVSRSRGIGRKQ